MFPSALNIILVLAIFIDIAYSLECYVCNEQENNQGKCTNTIKTCEYGEDVCLTEIVWGSMPYWSQGALKQLYISKRCSTKDRCTRYRESNMRLCSHISYEDWKCSDCCKGDRCNYFIMSGAGSNTVGAVTLLSALLVLIYQFKV